MAEMAFWWARPKPRRRRDADHEAATRARAASEQRLADSIRRLKEMDERVKKAGQVNAALADQNSSNHYADRLRRAILGGD